MTRMRVMAGAVLVSISLVASGCGGSADPGAGPEHARGGRGARAAAAAGHAMTGPELVAALADAGIGVLAAPADAAPVERVADPGPMRLLRDQVDVMANQTRDGTGTVGARLDGLVGPIAEGAPFSLVVAAYVKAGDTKGARLAREIMGEQTWARSESLVFPDVVLALFANDVARDSSASKPSGLRGAGSAAVVVPRAAPAGKVAGVCSTLTGWVDGILSTVIDALKVDTSGGGVTGFLGDIWNTVVDLAAEAGGALVKALTAPVVSLIKDGLAVAGTLSMVASLLRPWSVKVDQQPDPASFGVDPGDGQAVKVVATVDPGKSEPFTEGIIDCAQQAGISLPDPTSAATSKITWEQTGIEAVGTGIEQDPAIGSDNTASLRFTTRTESADAATKGAAVVHPIAVIVKVDRTQVQELQKLLATVLTGAVPGPVASVVDALFGVITQPIFDELAALLGTTGAGAGTVISHDPPEPTPGGGAEDECSGNAAGAIPDGTWTGPIALVVDGTIAKGAGAMTSTGSGMLTMTVKGGAVTSGTWKLDFTSAGSITVPGGTGSSDGIHVAITGTVGGAATKPHLVANYSASGSVTVSVQGFTTDAPVDVTGTAGIDMTVEESDCSSVSGTFIPSFNEASQGVSYFTGKARWTDEAA